MKYFLDTEFIEGFHKPLFGKRRHFIDLISIGIVAEDGREYYAISNEFNAKDADGWVVENVIDKIQSDLYQKQPPYRKTFFHEALNLKNLLKWEGKPNKQIIKEIIDFICPPNVVNEYAGVGSLQSGMEAFLQANPPEFYGYYSAYDWVLFCSLFGKMIDLPKGFPMYCKDLKHILEEENKFYNGLYRTESNLKDHKNFPKQTNEHNALEDARWNKQLFDFLQTL